jgi:magnesium-transporting ATPase (P-type)
MNHPSATNAQLEMTIDAEMSRHLLDSAKWGRFLAIVGLLGAIGISALTIVSMNKNPDSELMLRNSAAKAGYITGITIFIAVIYVIPCILLLRCSIKMRSALLANNQAELTQAFKLQKNLYMFLGILTIIFLIFFAIGLAGSMGRGRDVYME